MHDLAPTFISEALVYCPPYYNNNNVVRYHRPSPLCYAAYLPTYISTFSTFSLLKRGDFLSVPFSRSVGPTRCSYLLAYRVTYFIKCCFGGHNPYLIMPEDRGRRGEKEQKRVSRIGIAHAPY